MIQSDYIFPSAGLLEASTTFREIICSDEFRDCEKKLPIVVGTLENGQPAIFDLAEMPHLLVGGDGPESSAFLSAMILSLLFKKSPEELKLVILDPMHTALTHFAPLKHHYLAFAPRNPEVHEHPLRQRLKAIAGVQAEMDRRYQMLHDAGSHSFGEYNEHQAAEDNKPLPYIVMIVNDYQDLAALFDKRVESPIAAIAQKGRAVGIHAVLLSRSFSTSVITGVLKANFPARISFRTENCAQSKMILDREGAESLAEGHALALFGGSYIKVKCAECTKSDCKRVASHIASQEAARSTYLLPDVPLPKNESSRDSNVDPFLKCAVDYATSVTAISASMLQRRYTIGFNRATRLLDTLIRLGVVAHAAEKGKHKVLIEPKDIQRILKKALI